MKTAGSGNSCEYDGDGNKVKQVSGSYPLYYLWSSVLGEPVVELDGSGGVYRAYVTSSGGQMMGVQSYDGNFYWLHTDHLGNGRKLTNASGTVVYRAEFDPHGQILYEWQSSGQTYLNSHKFTGYERDWSTNLNYAKARTYNHNRGRFLQPDPLGLGAADLTNPQSLNLYSYVHNDPMNFVDPDGLNARMCFGYNVFLSEDGGESWRIIGFIPVFCWDIGGDGGGGGGGGGGTGNPQNPPPNKDKQPDPCTALKFSTIFTVGSYLQKAGLDKFISSAKLSGDNRGVILTFKDLSAARGFVANSPSFKGGGSGGGLMHAGELKEEFGEGKIEDYRSRTKGNAALGPRSLQVTFINNRGQGGAFADTDQYAYNESPKGFFGHLFKEVVGGIFRGSPCI